MSAILHNACPHGLELVQYLRSIANRQRKVDTLSRKGKGKILLNGAIERPKIPISTQRNLWIAAAGRCEFPGCDRVLWYDQIMLSEINYSNIAHIVAASPNGPRGDAVKSLELASDISNLMLMCPEHNHLIDVNEEEYTVEVLQEIKRVREHLIKRLFDDLCSQRTTVIKLSAAIGGSVPVLTDATIRSMLFPTNVAHDDDIIVLNYNDRPHDGDVAGLSSLSAELLVDVKDRIGRKERDGELYPPVSVFSIGRIPLLVSLGRALSATDDCTIYQLHRDTGSWRWAEESGQDLTSDEDIRLVLPSDRSGSAMPVVAVSISGSVSQDDIMAILGKDVSLFTIVAGAPGMNFMQYESQLRRFRDIWSQLMGEIREISPKVQKLPIFSAVPVSVAVQMGIQHIQADPCWSIYELRATKGGWEKAIELR